MAYAQPNDVRLVLQSIEVEQGGTAADLSDAQIHYEIDSASAMIDAALRVIYAVPFEPETPFLIKSICTDMAAYGCDLNYRKSREYDSQNMPIILRYNKARDQLNLIRLGTLTLDWSRADVDDGTLVVHQYDPALFSVEPFGWEPRW